MTRDSARGPAPAGLVDLDLHGVVGVRLVGATEADASAVAVQLGACAGPLARVPDVTVRFVPRVATAGLRYVEFPRTGYTDDGLVLLRHRRRRVRVRLPMGDAPAGDADGEIVCEHGGAPVPLLDAYVKLAALGRGHVPVHAAAFVHEGAGVLVAGWPHGGKTSCLLAFAAAGATFVSDDGVLLDADGTMRGIAGPVEMSGWQLDHFPTLRRQVAWPRRALLAGAAGLRGLARRGGGGAVGDALAQLAPAVERRTKVRVPAALLFADERPCAAVGTVFLAMTHASDEIRVEPADPETVAAQLATALRVELLGYEEQRLAHRFAFPHRAGSAAPLDHAEAEATRLLACALADARVFVVRHPHRAALAELHRAMRPHVSPRRATGRRAAEAAR